MEIALYKLALTEHFQHFTHENGVFLSVAASGMLVQTAAPSVKKSQTAAQTGI